MASEVNAMKPRLILFALALSGATTAAIVLAGAAAGSRDAGQARLHRGGGYFAIACGFSHRNQDDPIVFSAQRNRSHDHTYFGNRETDAFSTPDSLRASGRTTCRLRADTAAYWAPTLFVNGRPVEPLGVVAYYVRRTSDRVQPFPAGLKVIAGDAAARTPQSLQVTSWNCGGRRNLVRSSTVPTCDGFRRSSLRLQVNFPNCWDGSHLDSANHKSHLAYSANASCPTSHPVAVPALSLVIYYGIAGGAGAELSSGGQFSAHADFVNAWDQATLAALVDRYLNRSGYRGKR
jgi:uncharacterized protein DUF1996